jgi:serine/threonine-protein kinase
MTAVMQNKAQARVGRVLKEKWRLDGLLGVGGMAAVYSATHRNNKRVAIKMLLPELAGLEDVRERFVREGYAANTIDHPGALSVLDDDITEEGLPFLVMELLDGETVDACWRRNARRMQLAEVLAIGGATLDVLASAHTKGIVHRDIKPENLFLLRTGGLKVLDFGIARVMQEANSGATQTMVGTLMGTPAFMAPEQAAARWDEVDGRTDLWAVGATLFTLLTGTHVHEGATGNEQWAKSATQQARSIAACATGLPPSVVALVDRALRFDRLERWPDARAMQEAIQGAYEALTGAQLVLESPVSGPRSATANVRNPVFTTPTVIVGDGPYPVYQPPQAVPAAATRHDGGGRPPVMGTMPSQERGARAPSEGAIPAQAAVRTSSVGAMPAQSGVRMSAPSQAAAAPSHTVQSSAAMRAALPVRTSSTAAMPAAPAGARPSGKLAAAAALLSNANASVAGADDFAASRSAEREAAAAEVARVQPTVAEIQGRFAIARRKVVQMQEQIGAIRKERAAEEERFRRQMNTRLEGVGEARKAYRQAMGEVARMALADAANFPPEVGAAEREGIERTASVAAVRAKENAVHQAALQAFDPRALKTGIGILVAGAVLFLLLFFSPVIVRSCQTDTGTLEPPPSATPSP